MKKKEKTYFGIEILCSILPIVGLILYFIYRKTNPKMATQIKEGTIIGAILAVLFAIIFVIIVDYCLLPTVSNMFATHICVKEYGPGFRVTEINNEYKCKNFKTEEYKDFPWTIEKVEEE